MQQQTVEAVNSEEYQHTRDARMEFDEESDTDFDVDDVMDVSIKDDPEWCQDSEEYKRNFIDEDDLDSDDNDDNDENKSSRGHIR